MRSIINRASVKEFFGDDPALKFNAPLRGSAIDVSASAKHCSNGGAGIYKAERFDRGMTFVPSTSLYSSPLTMSGFDATMMVWAICHGAGTGSYPAAFSVCTAPGVGHLFYRNTANKWSFWFYRSSAWRTIDALAVSPLDQLVLLVGRNSNNIVIPGSEFLINGRSQGTSIYTANLGSWAFYLGSYANSHFFNGWIFEPAFFTRCLTLQEINDYYNWSLDVSSRKYFVVPTAAATVKGFSVMHTMRHRRIAV